MEDKTLKVKKWALLLIPGILIVGIAGYFGFKKYSEFEKGRAAYRYLLQELLKTQKEKETSPEINQGTTTLKAGADLDKKIKSQAEDTQKESSGIRPGSPASRGDLSLLDNIFGDEAESQSAVSNAKYVVRVICSNGSDTNSLISSGSGTIFGLNKFVITNYHVVEGMVLCKIGITDDVKRAPVRWFEAEAANLIPDMDIALLKPLEAIPDDVNAVAYNLCHPDDIELGDKVIVFGYPTVGGNTITATEGVVSGFEGFRVKTSAKIEHGNSGGGAFLLKNSNSCWFGIPTSVARGELESLGSIINYSLIHKNAQE